MTIVVFLGHLAHTHKKKEKKKKTLKQYVPNSLASKEKDQIAA